MQRQKSTLYDVLGLDQRATTNDITRTYRRIKSEMTGEYSAPNPRRAALVHEAYEVLTDPAKRAAYDKSLREDKFLGVAPGKNPKLRYAGVMAAIAAALGAAWWFTLGRAPQPVKQGKGATLEQIQAAASVSVGRVNRVEMSGSRTNLSAAVAIEEGVMMAPCDGIGPNAHILVRIPPRDIPAQVRRTDESIGLCRLAVSGGGSWPLPMSAVPPRAGDKVYAANLGPLGEVVIIPGEVKKVVRGERGNIVESTARAGPPVEGTPLLDNDGRVIAIALKGQHTMLPSAWIVDAPVTKRPPTSAAPAPQPPESGTASPGEAAAPEGDPRLKNVSPERRERLEKSFRPPPTVPKDL